MAPQPILAPDSSSANTTTGETKNPNASTGPKTPEGKARSSQNSFKHGLASKTMVIASESAEEWETFRDGMFAEWQPTTTTEEALVGDMAKHQWLKDRAIRYQHECMQYCGLDNDRTQYFSFLLRYQTTNERAFARALKQLTELRKMRQEEFVSQNAKSATEPAAPRPPKRAKVHPMHRPKENSLEKIDRDMNKFLTSLGLEPLPCPKSSDLAG